MICLTGKLPLWLCEPPVIGTAKFAALKILTYCNIYVPVFEILAFVLLSEQAVDCIPWMLLQGGSGWRGMRTKYQVCMRHVGDQTYGNTFVMLKQFTAFFSYFLQMPFIARFCYRILKTTVPCTFYTRTVYHFHIPSYIFGFLLGIFHFF